MYNYTIVSNTTFSVLEMSIWLKSGLVLGILYLAFALLRAPKPTTQTDKKPPVSSLFAMKDILGYHSISDNKNEDQKTPHSMPSESLASYLSGKELESMPVLFRQHLSKSLASLPIKSTWKEIPDLARFIEEHVGSALLTTLFGKELLNNDPTFLNNLLRYDKEYRRTLANHPPLFLKPQIYQIRDCLVASIENWHFGHYSNPDWATKMMRARYEALSTEPGQNEVSLALMDLEMIRS